MKKIFKIIALCLLVFTVSCEEKNGIGESSNVISFESLSALEYIEVGGTKTASVKFYAGNISGTDRTIGVIVEPSTTLDPAAYSVPTSVVLPGGTNEGVLEFQIIDSNISLSGGVLVIGFEEGSDLELSPAYYDHDENVNTPSIAQGYSVDVQYEFCPPSNSVVFELTLDTWPDETSWSVTDSEGNVLDSGGPYINPADDFAVLTFDYCLEAGDYTVTVLDSYGDGGPSFTVIVDGETVIDTAVSGLGTSAVFTVD